MAILVTGDHGLKLWQADHKIHWLKGHREINVWHG